MPAHFNPTVCAAGRAGDCPHPRLFVGVRAEPEGPVAADVVREALRDDQVFAGGEVQKIPVLVILFETVQHVPALVVREDEFRTVEQFLHVRQRNVRGIGVDHAEPKAVRASCLPGRLIKQVPVFGPDPHAPPDPFAVRGIFEIRLFRQFEAGVPEESLPAVPAVADPVPPDALPAVVREARRVIAFDDLRQDVRDVLFVVAARDAGKIPSLLLLRRR